eukprot:4184680-Amphidinium_carterae.1
MQGSGRPGEGRPGEGGKWSGCTMLWAVGTKTGRCSIGATEFKGTAIGLPSASAGSSRLNENMF